MGTWHWSYKSHLRPCLFKSTKINLSNSGFLTGLCFIHLFESVYQLLFLTYLSSFYKAVSKIKIICECEFLYATHFINKLIIYYI